jgi:hypothetical protein
VWVLKSALLEILTSTVVITVGVGTTNLAFGKHATQSSTYRYSDPVVDKCGC